MPRVVCDMRHLRPGVSFYSFVTSGVTAKLLVLSHSGNYIKFIFMVVSHKIFLVRLFAPPCLLRPGAIAPSAPLCYATASLICLE